MSFRPVLVFAVTILEGLLFVVLVLATSLPAAASSSCISINDAAKHVGASKCVSGKVLRIKPGERSVHFFDFCEDYRTAPSQWSGSQAI